MSCDVGEMMESLENELCSCMCVSVCVCVCMCMCLYREERKFNTPRDGGKHQNQHFFVKSVC